MQLALCFQGTLHNSSCMMSLDPPWVAVHYACPASLQAADHRHRSSYWSHNLYKFRQQLRPVRHHDPHHAWLLIKLTPKGEVFSFLFLVLGCHVLLISSMHALTLLSFPLIVLRVDGVTD